jgi:hypothetical protein
MQEWHSLSKTHTLLLLALCLPCLLCTILFNLHNCTAWPAPDVLCCHQLEGNSLSCAPHNQSFAVPFGRDPHTYLQPQPAAVQLAVGCCSNWTLSPLGLALSINTVGAYQLVRAGLLHVQDFIPGIQALRIQFNVGQRGWAGYVS